MEFIKLKELSKTNKQEVLNLWNNEYPEKLNYNTLEDFENYLENLTEQSHILMINETEEIKGWYFDFIREGEKWFAIVIDSKLQGKGHGTKILKIAKEKEIDLSGWVIDHNSDRRRNGEIYISPIDFYLKNGFKRLDKNRLELEKISAVRIKWRK
ncbi:GNAT family N-acetyltransferase [Lutimonas halocynthiae]|uniref:GNAT family N-acetyltransferase n=1 Tax=Lutimonas halocynthiae TaxID=1446477 RepID=UPI0025B5E8D0|nr:GNAT family N-acetyltransferase [Lutimonas halocynthiae]MDN3643197.1 GNAT family N-acetyltransferase [Lutimonas halocynthiae]